MQKFKGIALVCVVILFFSASCTKSTDLPQTNSGTHTVPLPPAAEPTGIKRTMGVNILTGLPEKQNELGKRPIAVMIDNVKAALPQRGISEADIIYEMVTESGITRLMALFSDYEAMPSVGPVRSARDQHVKLMLPLNTLFLHIGTSTYAAELLETYKYGDYSINGLYQPGALKLDADRTHSTVIEHCWFTNGEVFTQAATDYGLKLSNDCVYSAFNFASEPRELSGESAESVSVRFSSYVTSFFDYSAESKRYYKSQFGKPHVDENNGSQLSFDNVFVLFTDITKYPDGVLAKVRYEHGGVGYYFSKGKVEQVRWAKPGNTPLVILSADGKEQHVAVNPGKSYVAMVDLSLFEHFRIYAADNSEAISSLVQSEALSDSSVMAQDEKEENNKGE